MERASVVQNNLEQYFFRERRAKKFECNYFADEVMLILEYTQMNDLCYYFKDCHKVNIEHAREYDKYHAAKTMSYAGIPYFIFDIRLDDLMIEDEYFYDCQIDMGVLKVEIWCKDISVDLIDFVNINGQLCSEY